MATQRSARSARRAIGVVIAGAVVVLAAACGDSEEDRFAAAAEKARTSTTAPATEAPIGSGEPSEQPADGGTAFPGDTTSTTLAAVAPSTALLQAVDAFRTTPGAVRVKEINVQFPQRSRPYGIIRYQVPDAPGNVDARDWRDGKVQAAEPVRLTPADDLSVDLWDLDAVDWPAVAAVLPGAQALVEQRVGGPFEGSTGVTHLIVEDGAPFYPGVVVRVYVDGGARHGGGYVALHADGTVADVVA